jgi:hypothetical protein
MELALWLRPKGEAPKCITVFIGNRSEEKVAEPLG